MRKRFRVENLSKDISERIESVFGDNQGTVVDILNDRLEEVEYLRNERILRCIIFLAGNSVISLIKHLEVAENDPRDVMYWAEYIERTSLGDAKRVRDFNKPFHKNDLTIVD